MVVIKKLAITLLSSLAGLFTGTVSATPFIAWMNYLATDGPIFPPPLVAFGLIALPMGILIFVAQIILVIFELFSRRSMNTGLIPIAILSGSTIGALWYLILDPRHVYQSSLLALVVSGVLQALTVFACHWMANKLWFSNPKITPSHQDRK